MTNFNIKNALYIAAIVITLSGFAGGIICAYANGSVPNPEYTEYLEKYVEYPNIYPMNEAPQAAIHYWTFTSTCIMFAFWVISSVFGLVLIALGDIAENVSKMANGNNSEDSSNSYDENDGQTSKLISVYSNSEDTQ